MANYNPEKDKVEVYHCRWCDKIFDHEENLIKHIESEECEEI